MISRPVGRLERAGAVASGPIDRRSGARRPPRAAIPIEYHTRRASGCANPQIGFHSTPNGRPRKDESAHIGCVGVLEPGQAALRREGGRECGPALGGAAAMFLEVPSDQGLDGGPVVRVEVAAADEVVGQRPVLLKHPRLKGGHELRDGLTGFSHPGVTRRNSSWHHAQS